MRNKLLALLLVLALAFVPAVMAAEKINNKFCPVSGDEIKAAGEMGEPGEVEYKGKTYQLCCKMCIKDFNKDPEKYIKKIEEKEPTVAPSSTK